MGGNDPAREGPIARSRTCFASVPVTINPPIITSSPSPTTPRVGHVDQHLVGLRGCDRESHLAFRSGEIISGDDKKILGADEEVPGCRYGRLIDFQLLRVNPARRPKIQAVAGDVGLRAVVSNEAGRLRAGVGQTKQGKQRREQAAHLRDLAGICDAPVAEILDRRRDSAVFVALRRFWPIAATTPDKVTLPCAKAQPAIDPPIRRSLWLPAWARQSEILFRPDSRQERDAGS